MQTLGGGMVQIDYFLSAISPWVYLAGTRPAGIAARHGATLVYRPVDAAGLFARTGGKVLAERHDSRKAYRLQELQRWSAKLGMPLRLKPLHAGVNPAPSAYAILAAQKAGGGDVGALVFALGRALWAEDRDISDDGVIRACLTEAGFDPSVADRGLLASAEAYGATLEEAVARGVFGVPFWLVGEAAFWGQDRLDFLDAHLAAHPAGPA